MLNYYMLVALLYIHAGLSFGDDDSEGAHSKDIPVTSQEGIIIMLIVWLYISDCSRPMCDS